MKTIFVLAALGAAFSATPALAQSTAPGGLYVGVRRRAERIHHLGHARLQRRRVAAVPPPPWTCPVAG